MYDNIRIPIEKELKKILSSLDGLDIAEQRFLLSFEIKKLHSKTDEYNDIVNGLYHNIKESDSASLRTVLRGQLQSNLMKARYYDDATLFLVDKFDSMTAMEVN